MKYNQYNQNILNKIRETLRKQMDIGYNKQETAIMLKAFDIATRENGAFDLQSQKELDEYHLGMNLFLEKHLTII